MGVPDLVSDEKIAAPIADTFSAQWSDYEFGSDKTWNQTLDSRIEGPHGVLTHLQTTVDDLAGKTFLDAGCGNGEVTNEIAVRSGAKVYGSDISRSVFRAARAFPTVTFFRANIMEPALAPESFDFVHCGGVLHHTPSTRRALEMVSVAVKPGGRLFVWLYWHVAGKSQRVKLALRHVTKRLPSSVQQPIVDALAFPPYLLHRDTAWRNHRLIALDFYTPRYRWEHTPDQIAAWFADLGFADVRVVSEIRDGFGVLGVKA